MNRLGINHVFNVVIAALACVLVFPAQVFAHLVTTGMGPIYDGIGHFLLSPEDMVPVIALSLFAGLRGAAAGRSIMFLLPLAWFTGGLAGFSADSMDSLLIPALSFLIFGGLVASDINLPVKAVSAFALLFGLIHGFLNGMALRGGVGALGLVGTVIMMFIFITLISAFVVSLKKMWERIAVRVFGSWIAATGILILGWSMR